MALSNSILKEFLDLNMYLFYGDWRLIRDNRLPALARSLINRLKYGSVVPLPFTLFYLFSTWKRVLFPLPEGMETSLLVPIISTVVISILIMAGIIQTCRQLKKFLPQLYRIAEDTAVEQPTTA